MILNIIIAVVALVLGGLCGYFIFRYVLTGKYNEMISAAQKEAEVLKEKKKLEVKEIFLNKKHAKSLRFPCFMKRKMV